MSKQSNINKQLQDKALEYLKYQLSVIPTKADKLPAVSSWKPYQSERIEADEVESLFTGETVKGLAVICGAVSGNLEVIDVDTKHDTTGTLWDEFRTLIQDNLPELYTNLVIAQTISGGYHIYYRCETIAGNLKLSFNKKKEILIETRGVGGYVIAPPTPGYKYIQGDPGNIPTITPEDRQILFSLSKSFTEIDEAPEKPKYTPTGSYKNSGLSPFEDYNQRGDLVGFLESKGWSYVFQSGRRIFLLRPGESKTKYSSNFHTDLRTLRVFSSSTVFDTDKAYSPSSVFSLLECNGDQKETYKKLLAMGYGEPYNRVDVRPTQIKTERIKVETVNKVNRVTSVISTPGETLTINNILTATGEEVIITPAGSEAQEEILRAIEFILQTGKRIYIKEGEAEIREYRYQLRTIFNKYGTIQDESGGLTDRDRDSLLDEVVILSTKLQPVDRDILLKEFIDLEAVKELGITKESLSITVDRLTATKDKERQAQGLQDLIEKVKEHQERGETKEALELMNSTVKEVKLQDKATEFNKLLQTTSEAQIKQDERNSPESLDTGYTIGEDELYLPGGAISVCAAPTNHGKTLFLINTALNVADKYPDKKFIFFTYEERDTTILQYFLNTYVDIELNNSGYRQSNRRIIKGYFKTGSTQYIRRENIEYFETKKEEFFKTYIETGRILIKYVDYSSEELDLAIRYLHEKAPDIGGVFIDYFQLLNLPGKIKRAERINSRQEELKQICMSLKETAVDTGLPLFLAAQFNREATNLERLHPTNIGEAGDIERIVNTLVGLWSMDKKPVLKGITEPEKTAINQKLSVRRLTGEGEGNMYIEILKSRDLPTGSFDFLELNGKTGKIKNRTMAGENNFFK